MKVITIFFFEEAKMDYITNSKGFPSTRCSKEKTETVSKEYIQEGNCTENS